jgi:hypothetical protein
VQLEFWWQCCSRELAKREYGIEMFVVQILSNDLVTARAGKNVNFCAYQARRFFDYAGNMKVWLLRETPGTENPLDLLLEGSSKPPESGDA